jgi:membrane-associated protease RseP (regulator of RpoE activity)
MIIRSLASIVIVVSSYVFVIGQTPDVKKESANGTAKMAGGGGNDKLRDMPFPAGVSLQFLVKELASDMDLNVLFDPESRLELRKVRIELKNVTTAEALNLLLLQEGLYSEEVGPKTILVGSRLRGTSIPQLGLGITPLTQQLAEYFGVAGGILINSVRRDSPGAKAGLKAGDVIVAIDSVLVRGALGVVRVISAKKEGDFTLKIVRDRKDRTVALRLDIASP